jgi:DNA ligase (NAD+)
MNTELEKLVEELRRARESYYNLEPTMSDSEYDKKKEKLIEIDPSNFEVKAVGAYPSPDSTWEKIKHRIPMGSLDKVNTTDEFDTWAIKTGVKNFSITHKIDGASLELAYENGRLIYGATRGDGIVGEDITSNVTKIPSVLQSINKQGIVTVRGEVVMLKSVFEEKYSDKYANPRNTASAKMREKKRSGKDCENLEFLAYWIKSDDMPKNMSDVKNFLNDIGFKTPYWEQGNVECIKHVFNKVSKSRSDIPYEIDGMVVSVDDIETMLSLGEIAMRPRGQIAWKFESEKAQSNVIDVVWQVGPTGRVTPVAKVKPTKIGGVTIESVSLHNVKMFSDLKLSKGCRVVIERRNDVIPYISQNLDLTDV